ncbi:MAG: M1 family peptidase, partial [Fidelibacterota bacterium]
IVEEAAGRDLGWFFELYLRQEALPELRARVSRGKMRLRWKTPRRLPFPMPVPVQIGEDVHRLEMRRGRGAISIPEGLEPVIDPQHRVLKVEEIFAKSSDH